jgi:hypothetical protein
MIHSKILIFIKCYFYQNFVKSPPAVDNRALAGIRESRLYNDFSKNHPNFALYLATRSASVRGSAGNSIVTFKFSGRGP